MLTTEIIPYRLKPADLVLELREVPDLPQFKINQLGHVYYKRYDGKTVPKHGHWAQWNRGWRVRTRIVGKKWEQWFLVRELVAWAFLGKPDVRNIKAWPIDRDWHNHTLPNLVQLSYDEAIARGLMPKNGHPRPWMNETTLPSFIRED
jgi:hypothetical protein